MGFSADLIGIGVTFFGKQQKSTPPRLPPSQSTATEFLEKRFCYPCTSVFQEKQKLELL